MATTEEQIAQAFNALNLRIADLDSSNEQRNRENIELQRQLNELRVQAQQAAAGAPAAPPQSASAQLIDTRMMSKPTVFTGAMEQWAD